MSCPKGIHTHTWTQGRSAGKTQAMLEEICCPSCKAQLRLVPPGEVRCDACGVNVIAEWQGRVLALRAMEVRSR